MRRCADKAAFTRPPISNLQLAFSVFACLWWGSGSSLNHAKEQQAAVEPLGSPNSGIAIKKGVAMSRPLRLMMVLLLVSSCAMAQEKKRVAVLDFDYGTVKSVVQAAYGTDQDIGKGISLLLEQKLVQDGKYRVIDRNAMEKILKEQNFSNSDRVDPNSAAKIGRILGVNAIITGTITQFGRDDKHIGVSGGGYGGAFGHAIGGLHKNEAKAVVNITAKMIDINTAEILAVATGSGESKRGGLGIGGGGGGWGGGGGGAVDMGSSNFANSIVGEATNAAVASLGQQIDDKADSLPAAAKVPVSGLVADVEGSTIILTVGAKAGVKVGDTLTVARKGKEIKDPASGAVIKVLTTPVGTATVTQVDDTTATATFSGAVEVKVGDIVSN